MAITKVDVVFQASSANVAGGTTTGTGVDLTLGYGCSVNVRMTNGISAPTLACNCYIQVSNDNADWYEYAVVYGNITASSVVEESVIIGKEHQYVRTVFKDNTGQTVTVEADGSNITGV